MHPHCAACGCDTIGTVPGELCDKSNGQCQCQPGVGGRQCDQCDPFFVNFTSDGCSGEIQIIENQCLKHFVSIFKKKFIPFTFSLKTF